MLEILRIENLGIVVSMHNGVDKTEKMHGLTLAFAVRM